MTRHWKVGDEAEAKGEIMGAGFESSWYVVTVRKVGVHMKRRALDVIQQNEVGSFEEVPAFSEGTQDSEMGCIVEVLTVFWAW